MKTTKPTQVQISPRFLRSLAVNTMISYNTTNHLLAPISYTTNPLTNKMKPTTSTPHTVPNSIRPAPLLVLPLGFEDPPLLGFEPEGGLDVELEVGLGPAAFVPDTETDDSTPKILMERISKYALSKCGEPSLMTELTYYAQQSNM